MDHRPRREECRVGEMVHYNVKQVIKQKVLSDPIFIKKYAKDKYSKLLAVIASGIYVYMFFYSTCIF